MGSAREGSNPSLVNLLFCFGLPFYKDHPPRLECSIASVLSTGDNIFVDQTAGKELWIWTSQSSDNQKLLFST